MPAVAAASAAADSPLEGVWSFNGGRVAIQSNGNGTLTGTVLSPTKFAECEHVVGERMWTDITPQPDGSYSGLHQWFYAESGCKRNPTLGLSAWRILAAGGGKILQVCLSEPGEPQPTIPAEGELPPHCFNSALVAALPNAIASEFLPESAACIASDGKLPVRIRNPQSNPLAQITVVVKGGGIRKTFRLKPRPKSFIAVLDLTPIVAPTVRATVRVTTVLGAHLRHRQVYRRC